MEYYLFKGSGYKKAEQEGLHLAVGIGNTASTIWLISSTPSTASGFGPLLPHLSMHTYCSDMARSGINPKTLQYLMDRSDISVTMNTYTHPGPDDARDGIIRLEQPE